MKRRAFLGGSTAAVAVVTVAPVLELPVVARWPNPPAKAYFEAVTDMGFGLAPVKTEGAALSYDGEDDGI